MAKKAWVVETGSLQVLRDDLKGGLIRLSGRLERDGERRVEVWMTRKEAQGLAKQLEALSGDNHDQ